MADLKAAAYGYWSQGCNIVLLKGKQPLHEWQKWQIDRQSEAEFEGLPWDSADGFGVVCGMQLSNGLYLGVIDFDVKNVSEEAKQKGKEVLRNFLITQIEETPSGGQHWVYFCHNKPKTISSYHHEYSLELLGEGKLCIMALSQGYKRLNDNTPTIVQDLEQLLLDAIFKSGVTVKQDGKADIWFDREDFLGKPFKGKNPPCIDRIFCGTTEGLRNEFAIRLSAYLVNFKRLELEKAWKLVKEWNKWNTPPLPEGELKAAFQSAVRNKYVFGCNDNIFASLCEKNNCTVSKKQKDNKLDKVFDPQVEAEINIELDKILDAENQVEALKPHLNRVLVGEDDSKIPIFVLLLGSKYQEPEFKQIVLIKATEGSGKTTLIRNLAEGYKVKDVGRFSAHALDYTNLEGYEILSLKELGSMDMEKQGVSTIKFLSSDDRGYNVEVTVRDEVTGKFKTESYKIPCITVISTTTRLILDSQFERRAWIFGMDESPQQTEKVAKWKAGNEREKAEVLLGKRKITSLEFSQEVIRRFVAQIKPVKIVIPFPYTLSGLLGFDVLRVRGDIDKLYVFVKFYAALNMRRLTKLKEGVYAVTPQVCMEALQIAEKPLVGMLSRMDERAKVILSVLKEIKDVKDEIVEVDGERQKHEIEIRWDVKGSQIDKKVREQIAVKIGKCERTVREFFSSLENSGYVGGDQRKPKTYTLLYDISEIEEKLIGISAKFKSADILMEKMVKETQKWLQTGLENQPSVDAVKNFEHSIQKEHDSEDSKNFIATSRERISNLVLRQKQVVLGERNLEDWLNSIPPICRGEKQAKNDEDAEECGENGESRVGLEAKPSIQEVLERVRAVFVEGTEEEWIKHAVENGLSENEASSLFESLKGTELFWFERDGQTFWRWVHE